MNRLLFVTLLLLFSYSLFAQVDGEFAKNNYDKQEVYITMRDGVRLFTSIYTPKDQSKTYPILIKRTPYSCRPYGTDQYPNILGPNRYIMQEGYIVVYQDVRGRWMSEGDYDNMRPHVPNKKSKVDIDESSFNISLSRTNKI